MTPKIKLLVFVVGAAFVSALITVFFQFFTMNRYYPMPMMGMNRGVDHFTVLEGSAMKGMSAPNSAVSDMGMMEFAPGEEYLSRPYIPPYYGQDDALDVDERAIEMSSNQSVVVDDVNSYLTSNKDFIESVGGRVLSYNQGTQSSQALFGRPTSYGYINARVPIDQFDEVNQRLGQNIKKVVYQSVNAQDVTGQVVAIDESLESLKDDLADAQARLEEAENDSQRRVIEREIQRLETQIENVENNQQAVDQRVTYAYVNVSVANNEEYFTPTWRTSWMDMVWSFLGSFSGLAYIVGTLVIYTLLYSILWLPIMLGARAVRRAFAKKPVSSK